MISNDSDLTLVSRILDEFRGRGWMPLTPKLLDYENTQFLIIGHNEGALEKATVPQADDVKQEKEEPKEEIEKLEHEDNLRVDHLKGEYLVPYPQRGKLPMLKMMETRRRYRFRRPRT